MGIFRVLSRMHCSRTLTLLTIAQLAEVAWNVTGVEWFPFNFKRSRFIYIPPVPRVTRKRADVAEATEGGYHETRPVYLKSLRIATCRMISSSGVRTCFLKKMTTIPTI